MRVSKNHRRSGYRWEGGKNDNPDVVKASTHNTQMILAFVASAALVLVISMICLILHPSNRHRCANPFDRFFRTYLCLPIQRRIGFEKAENWASSIFAMVITISDQQSITGIAILAAAIHSLAVRSITVYHFNIVTDMGWFSSNIHLLSLCVMRHFLDARGTDFISELKAVGVIPRTLRILSMLTLAVLLLRCVTVSGYELWNDKQNCPATCVTGGKRAGWPFKQMIVTYVFVIQSYSVQIIRVIPPIVRAWNTSCQPWVQSFDQSMAGRVYGRKGLSVLYSVSRDLVMLVFYFFTSDFEFMLEMVAWFVLGLYWTFTDRLSGHKNMDHDDVVKENQVGFGQLVPILLLALAGLAMMEAYSYRPSRQQMLKKREPSISSIEIEDINLKSFEAQHEARPSGT
ncbi:hypothetical protein BT63DRAFT_455362 [Microthyrium microscopicum]|uniref:Uncharacterized protein n=1 Tax=Microthyrium microscopicum TaxID=703497 RepID=A0A6A6UBT6_9PEZI|nr:hypothetical protein BT63DRAFT_455362 [Microthyrium microscopicum]